MSIEAITEASVGLDEEYIPMVISYIKFLKSYKPVSAGLHEEKTNNIKTPKDALNMFKGSLLYMADDFNKTPDEFEEYIITNPCTA